MKHMNQRTSRLLLSAALVLLSGCSDDDGANVEPKPPVTNAGTGGAGGGSGSGGNGGAGGSGDLDASAGGSAGAPVDAGFPPCVPATDAGVSLDAGDAGDAGDAAPIAAPLVSYETQLYPVFRARCVPCHETERAGGHNIGSPDLDESYRDARTLGSSLPDRVNEGGMPPPYAPAPNNCNGPLGSSGCVSVEEFNLIQRWIGQCYPR